MCHVLSFDHFWFKYPQPRQWHWYKYLNTPSQPSWIFYPSTGSAREEDIAIAMSWFSFDNICWIFCPDSRACTFNCWLQNQGQSHDDLLSSSHSWWWTINPENPRLQPTLQIQEAVDWNAGLVNIIFFSLLKELFHMKSLKIYIFIHLFILME